MGEGAGEADISFQRYLDMRYAGQEFPIRTPVAVDDLESGDREALRRAFDRAHARRFGHQAPGESVEVVNLRLTARARRRRSAFPAVAAGAGAPSPRGWRDIVLDDPASPVRCPAYERDDLFAGARVAGPAAISEYASTLVLFSEDRLEVAPSGELVIEIGAS